MKRQNGAALVVVLALLSISLMVGLSSMQSSQVDERLAGNYKAQSEVQMGAEKAISVGLDAISTSSVFLEPDSDPNEITWQYFIENGNFDGQAPFDAGCDTVDCYFRLVRFGSASYIVAMASLGGGSAISEPLVVSLRFSPFSGLSDLSPLTVVSRIFNFRSGNASNFGISRRGEENIGTAIAVADDRDVETVLDGIPDNRKDNYANDCPSHIEGCPAEGGNIVAEQDFDVFSDPDKMQIFVDHIKSDPNTSASIGTSESPKVTYIGGDYVMPKDIGVGGGILVVDGDFTWNGNNNFEGLIIVLGQNFTYSGGGSGSIIGALLHAPVVESEDGAWSYGIAEADASEVDLRGGGASIIQHDVGVLDGAAGLLPKAAAEIFTDRPSSGGNAGTPTISTWN